MGGERIEEPLRAQRGGSAQADAYAGRRQVRAAANFRLGEYLFENGHAEAAKKYFEEAKRLRPESWNYKRQAWALEDPMKAGGPEFWAAVDSLGDGKYYPGPEDI